MKKRNRNFSRQLKNLRKNLMFSKDSRNYSTSRNTDSAWHNKSSNGHRKITSHQSIV